MSDEIRYGFRAAVFVIVRSKAGHILLQQRAGTNFLPGYYDFPSGHVEIGESFAEAAVREVAEESCLKVRPEDLTLRYLGINNLDQSYVNVIYEATTWQGEPRIGEPHKCSDMQFFAQDALPEKCSLAVRTMASQGFAFSGGQTYIDLAAYEALMGEPFTLQ